MKRQFFFFYDVTTTQCAKITYNSQRIASGNYLNQVVKIELVLNKVVYHDITWLFGDLHSANIPLEIYNAVENNANNQWYKALSNAKPIGDLIVTDKTQQINHIN